MQELTSDNLVDSVVTMGESRLVPLLILDQYMRQYADSRKAHQVPHQRDGNRGIRYSRARQPDDDNHFKTLEMRELRDHADCYRGAKSTAYGVKVSMSTEATTEAKRRYLQNCPIEHRAMITTAHVLFVRTYTLHAKNIWTKSAITAVMAGSIAGT